MKIIEYFEPKTKQWVYETPGHVEVEQMREAVWKEFYVRIFKINHVNHIYKTTVGYSKPNF